MGRKAAVPATLRPPTIEELSTMPALADQYEIYKKFVDPANEEEVELFLNSTYKIKEKAVDTEKVKDHLEPIDLYLAKLENLLKMTQGQIDAVKEVKVGILAGTIQKWNRKTGLS